MRGSYTFSYQNNGQQIIETNPPRVSLAVQNNGQQIVETNPPRVSLAVQNNGQQIVETNPPRVSLAVQNHSVVYQNRINTVNQVIPVTYTTYHPKDSILV
jgi:hypothetical protein